MSSSSSAPARAAILRGRDADQVTIARMDSDLRESPYAIGGFADRRLVDPVLAAVFDTALTAAREQAHKDGFAQGYAEGLELAGREKSSVLDYEVTRAREAEAIRDHAMQRALEALDLAANALGERQAAALAGSEDLLLSAALDLATTLLGRELEIADSPVRDALRRALAVLPTDVPVTVSVHPLDMETLGDAISATTRSVRVIADPDVEPGSCIADGGATHVDASLTAAIERVRQVLTP